MDDDGVDEIGAIAISIIMAAAIVGASLYQWNYGKHFYVELSCGPTYSEPCR